MFTQIDKIGVHVAKTRTFYKNLGYEIPKSNEIFVNYWHLTSGSHEKISYSCDHCGKSGNREYRWLYGRREHLCVVCGAKEVAKHVDWSNVSISSKSRIGALHQNWKANKSGYDIYKRCCLKYTLSVDTSSLENNEKPRGTSGDVYQLDHRYSIKSGYENCVPAYLIGSFANLQIIHRIDNRKKWSDCNIELFELIEYEKNLSEKRTGILNSIKTESDIYKNLDNLDSVMLREAFLNTNTLSRKDGIQQAILSKLGAKASIGSKAYTDGISTFKYLKVDMMNLSFEDFLNRNPGFKAGTRKKGSRIYLDNNKKTTYTAIQQKTLSFEDFLSKNPHFRALNKNSKCDPQKNSTKKRAEAQNSNTK